jgi:ankyrin repeat protein
LLFKACQDGFKDIVQLLISKGADGRIHPVTKYSPLYIAAYHGRKEIVEILLNHFPNLVNVATVEKWLPIHAAAINNHLHIIDLLLNFDYPKLILQTFHDKNKQYEYYIPFDINAQDVTGQTILYVAALVGNQRLIDFLLNFKVSAIKLEKHDNELNSDVNDKNTIDSETSKPINCDSNHSSPGKRKSSSIQKIIDKLSPTHGDIIYSKNRSDDDSCPQMKQLTIFPILLDVYCNNSETALHASVKKKHYSIASALLSHGSNPNLAIYLNGDDRTQVEDSISSSLKEACRNRDASMVDLLIRYGARDDDCLALKVASTNGDNHLMSKILSLKSHPDPEFKINKKSLQFNTGSGGVSFVGTSHSFKLIK